MFRVTDVAWRRVNLQPESSAPLPITETGLRSEHTTGLSLPAAPPAHQAPPDAAKLAAAPTKMARSHEFVLRFWGGALQAKTVTRTGGCSTENPTAVA